MGNAIKCTTVRLKTDIYSHVTKDPKSAKNKLLYGSKGERVAVVSDHGNVLIVEDKNGKKYSVKREDIYEQSI